MSPRIGPASDIHQHPKQVANFVCHLQAHLRMGLCCPSERLLSALAAIQFLHGLQSFELNVDFRGQEFGLSQATSVCGFGKMDCVFTVHLYNARVVDVSAILTRISQCNDHVRFHFVHCDGVTRTLTSQFELLCVKEALWMFGKKRPCT